MKVTINDCMPLDAFEHMRLVAGEKSGDNRITSVSVMDASTVADAIKYNGVHDQLVLTSFSGMKADVAMQKKTVAELTRCAIAGMVVYCGTKGVSHLDKSVIDTASELGLPLIVLDREYSCDYGDVSKQVMEKILFGNNFDNRLINNMIYHLLNFERYSSFQIAIREAAINNGIQVVLLSEEFNPVFSVETRQTASIAEAIRLGKEREVGKSQLYQLIEVNGVLTYWGVVQLNKNRYYLFIVDNDDNYSSAEITKLAEIIQLAMGMWKFTPDRDARAEFLKTLIRGNKSLAYSIREEAEIVTEDILSVFYAKNIETSYGNAIIADFEEKELINVLNIDEDGETYGIVFKGNGLGDDEEASDKAICNRFYEKLKESNKGVRIFHATGIDGIEGAGDSFRLISETWTFVESVFPYKRVFTKYELALVSNCIQLQVQGGYLKKNYMDLLEPFKRELGENKSKQLLETLETFVLDAGMNGGKTADFLGVHVNTVQYRLKRINEILGAEITGNRVIPGLTMALALKRLERVTK